MANHRFQGLKLWRKLTRREWTIAAASLSILIFTISFISHSQRYSTNSTTPANNWIPFTPLSNAQHKSACNFLGHFVLLSLIFYFLFLVFGYVSSNWIVKCRYLIFFLFFLWYFFFFSLFRWKFTWVSFAEGFWIWVW